MTYIVHRWAGAVLVVTFIVAHARTYLPSLSLLLFVVLGVVLLVCCVWMSDYFVLLVCFD